MGLAYAYMDPYSTTPTDREIMLYPIPQQSSGTEYNKVFMK